ncbi:MAG: response regulator [Verrucomicrobia bacterium]|nr:response regulator [Verrucomicrobiota bacterium]
MNAPLKILYVEEDEIDAGLVKSILESGGLFSDLKLVSTEADFRAALQDGHIDLILSDFQLPDYDGLLAIKLAQELRPEVPFIFVSGTIGEDKAIEMLTSGAMDYVLRNYIGRIVPSVIRALRESETRRQRHKAEEKIREQAALIDITRDAILVQGLNQAIRFWNKGAERIYGWTEAEAVGRDATQLLFKKGFPQSGAVFDALLERGVWMGELTQVNKDGQELMIESRWTLMRDQHGEPAAVLIVNTDITEKKKLEAQFLRSQRMESIGTLAGGIAHDLNNVLAPILMATHVMRMKFKEPDAQKLINTLESSAQRGAGIVRQVLTFARGVAGERSAIHCKALVEDMARIVRETFPKNIACETRNQKGLWLINGDLTQLDQVLLNLCVNARDAMPGGGKMILGAENVQVDEQYARLQGMAKAGPHVQFFVSDTGSGIPPEVLEKMFEPFYTTKDPGKGTGLGLSTVLGIVKSHEGFIDVDTKIGGGTTFKVFIPALPIVDETKVQTRAESLPRGSGETILVVDDDPSIREVTKATLEAGGYRAIVAADGVEAIAIFSKQVEAIAAVMTEMTMPVIDGGATIRVLQRLKPDVKIIVSSGVASAKFDAEAEALGVKIFLRKPFSAEYLLTKLHDVLRA